MKPYNWLAYEIHDKALLQVLKRYTSGVLVDIGCGRKPYAIAIRGLVTHHIGIDIVATQHDRADIDILASVYDIPLADASADTLLCTAVLEHLERPEDAIWEMRRVLKPGGNVILTAPLFWHLHEESRDFYRYTEYGLKYLFAATGFETVEVRPLSGFAVTFGQELVYYLNPLRRGLTKYLAAGMQWIIQMLAYFLNRWDRSYQFTAGYLAVIRRPTL